MAKKEKKRHIPSGPYRHRTKHRRVVPHAAKQHASADFPLKKGGPGKRKFKDEEQVA